MTTAVCDTTPMLTTTPRRARLTAKLLVPQEADGYAVLRPMILLWAELLALYDPEAQQDGLRQVTWLTAIACRPTARLYGFYDGETLVGSVLAEVQEVAYTPRVWIHFCSIRPGVVTGAAGRCVEQDICEWGKRNGATYLESETGRKPDVWSRRFRGSLHGYIMRKPL